MKLKTYFDYLATKILSHSSYDIQFHEFYAKTMEMVQHDPIEFSDSPLIGRTDYIPDQMFSSFKHCEETCRRLHNKDLAILNMKISELALRYLPEFRYTPEVVQDLEPKLF